MWKRLAHKVTFDEISRQLNISVSTAQGVNTLFEITGDVSAKVSDRPKKYLRKLDAYMELFIIGVVLEKPTLYLSELCELRADNSGIEVSEATVCRLLQRHGFTQKKVRQTALQRSTYLRGYFMSQVLLYNRQMFVWLDETGCDNCNYVRKYGYAIRGLTPVCRRILIRGTRISIITAMGTDGLVACECTKNTVDSEMFFDFVRGSVIPQMHAFDGSSPKSIVILDNCSIHRMPEITTLFESVGISPTLQPRLQPH